MSQVFTNTDNPRDAIDAGATVQYPYDSGEGGLITLMISAIAASLTVGDAEPHYLPKPEVEWFAEAFTAARRNLRRDGQ